MALRAGYYGVKRFLRNKLETIAETYDETIKNLFPRSEQSILGARNILTFPYLSTSGTSGGVTWTVNSDCTVTANAATPTENNVYFQVNKRTVEDLPAGRYIYSVGYGSENTSGFVQAYNGNTWVKNLVDLGADTHKSFILDFIGYDNIRINVRVNSGKSVDNITFKPQLLLVSEPDISLYTLPTMTNRELTISAADQKTAINAIITAATDAADFAAFKTAMGAITPVTRSLSLTKEDITEEVKEDVEPEKTVTKKRTTKKTEEE